jgi:PEP-CTERM motif
MTWIKTAVLATLCCAAASAGPITFTEVLANASGSLDGTSFTAQTVTLVLTGDTSTITNPSPGFFLDLGTATVSISGGGTDTFTDSMGVDDNQTNQAAGIADETLGGFDVLDVFNPAFGTYALNTSIGPLSGGSGGNSGDSFPTVNGTFSITSPLDGGHPDSFTAALGSVPEPGTFGLIGAGIGLVLIRRRVRRALAPDLSRD